MLSLQIYTYRGKWGVTYLDSINWDNVCELLPIEGRSESTEDMLACVKENLKEGMEIYMTEDDAMRLVIEAAEKHVDRLRRDASSWLYASEDSTERVYREAITKAKEIINVHKTR